MKRRAKVPRPRSLRQSLNAVVRYGGKPRFSDFIEQLCRDHLRVRIELHGTADINGIIAWTALDTDVFVVEQDKIGLKLLRISSVIGISKGTRAQ